MKHYLTSPLSQAIFSRGFIISAAGTALILLLSSVQGILAGFRADGLLACGYHSDLVMSALSSDAMALALPILAALPYTASFVDDVKSGFIKEYLPRTTVPRYIAGKAVGCAVSGRLTLALGIFIAYGFAALTDSKYMAYASPFVLFYLLIILYERYFDKLFVLYPREWLNPSPRWVFGKIGVAVLLTEFSLLMALAFFATPCAKWTREL